MDQRRKRQTPQKKHQSRTLHVRAAMTLAAKKRAKLMEQLEFRAHLTVPHSKF
jgi:hypothetical protein